MFVFGYLILVAIAAIPLVRTLLRYRGRPASLDMLHRLYRDLAYIAAAVLAIIVLETTFRISLENYWFVELGQQYRFWFALGLQAAIFATVLVFGGLFVALNLRLASRHISTAVPPSAPWIAGFVIAALVASGAAGLWTPLTAFLGATPSGVIDPVFGKDLSFYLLELPFYESAVGLAMTLLVITLFVWAAVGIPLYLRPLVRPTMEMPWGARRPRLALVEDNANAGPVDVKVIAARHAAWDNWLVHGLALAALFCLGCAALRFLG